MLSDFWPHGQVAQAYGVLRPDGYVERVIFVIDKAGIVRYIDVNDIAQQPDNEVIFRVGQAPLSSGLMKPGERSMRMRFVILIAVALVVTGVSGCSGSDSLNGRPGMLYFYLDT